MQIILKEANQGKTTEAIKAAYTAANNHPVLFVSSEETAESVQQKINWFGVTNSAFTNRYDIVIADRPVTPETFDNIELFDRFGTIVLDVNYAMSRGPWITIIAKLEERGHNVVATQILTKPAQSANALVTIH